MYISFAFILPQRAPIHRIHMRDSLAFLTLVGAATLASFNGVFIRALGDMTDEVEKEVFNPVQTITGSDMQ